MTDNNRHVGFDDLDDNQVTVQQLQSILAQLDTDAAEMSGVDLAWLRSGTLTAVAQGFPATAERKPTAMPANASNSDSGSAMRALFRSRGMAVFTSLASLMFAVWLFTPTTAKAETTLSELLQQLRDASSVTMQIQKPNGTSFVTLKAPGVVRWDDGDRQYRVADGHRLWRVNETTGEITDEPSPLPSEGLNALSLLELTDLKTSAQTNPPTTYEVMDGERCAVHEAPVRMAHQPAVLRAFTDELTGRIKTLHLLSATERALLAEVRLTSLNESLPAEAFRVTRSLKDDGRAGVISEIHGLVFVRAFPGHRWTPATNTLPLFVGDQIRCDARGANAAVIRLMSGTEITLGPSGLLEIGPENLRLLNGDVKVESSRLAPSRRALQGASGETRAGPTIVASLHGDQEAVNAEPISHANTLKAHLAERDGYIEGPEGTTIALNATAFYRTTGSPPKLHQLDTEPTWFKTLSENLTAETMGSLIAQVDGRDVSLTLGFHHVTVEIRDQIARTVIEESFVNNTDQRLEGQFHFPLPHDASISGFGMWIGDQLIEADVVEKQRAREIYETILREKRDPGLLEWEGGNIFKARVFPIEARGEKKIRITYTQTLPLQNGTFRYHYPLRSELLQKTPLRDLAIDLTIHSGKRIARLECPSHGEQTREPIPASVDAKASTDIGIRQVGDVTIEQTANSARVHYEAREITPERDFEVHCSLDSRQSDVVAIPHVRGDDGYFQLQLSPPSVDAGNWSRMMVRDGTPLDVIVVCDTSRSMDKAARDKQHDVVAALLSSLSESDRIRVACCDVKTTWLLKESEPATEKIRNAVLEKLKQRRSLGWSDLQRCFASILEAAGEKTHIIYVGDGTVVAEDSQAGSAFVSWFNVARVISRKEPTCHAIAVGNAYDMTVLSAIGRKGGGTTRVCSYSTSATDTVRDLLFEITRPGLRDLKVEFRNVQVAAVYPAELPNVPDGLQQIITGRFLPSANDAAGEVIVTGRRGDEMVKYVARMPLHETRKEENSFIPRLWAKQHIDHLLLEASTPEIKQQIIALSQEFHLITPFTSLLVLETDADRKRFGVERSMQMRDGEQFFAEGRKEAEYSLRQQQLETAKLWRQRLHAQMRAHISRFGRDEFENSHVTLPQSQNVFSFYVPLDRGSDRQTSRGRRLLREELQRDDVDDFMTLYADDTQDEYVKLQSVSPRFSEGELFFDQLTYIRDRFSTISDDFVVPESSRGDQFSEHRFDAVNAWDTADAPNLYLGYSNNTVLPQPDYLSDDVQYFGNSGGLEGSTNGRYFLGRNVAGVPILNEIPYTSRLFRSTAGRGKTQRGYRSQSENKYYAGHYLTLDILDGTSPPSPNNAIHVEPPTFGVRDAFPSAKAAEPEAVNWPDRLQKWLPAIVYRQPAAESTASAEFNADWPSDVLEVMKSVSPRFEKLSGGLVLKHVERSLHPTRQSSRLTPPRRALQGASGNPSAGTSTVASLHSDKDAVHAEPLNQANTLEAHLAERDGYVDDWNTITWLPSLGWSWDQKSSLGPIRRWSIGDSSGAANRYEKLGHYVVQSETPKKCSIPYEFVDQRYGNPTDSIWADWLPKLESRSDSSAVILMTHRTQPWQEIRLHYDLSKRCALQQDTLTDGLVVSQIKLSEHQQVADSWIATRVEIRELEPLSNELVTTNRHTLELQEIAADEATAFLESSRLAPPRRALQGASGSAGAGKTNVASLLSDEAAAAAQSPNHANPLEAHLEERDGYIMLPQVLPSASAAKKAIEAGNATLADKFARIFELWHQSRWDEAIPLLDQTLAEHTLTGPGLWIRRWLLIDARRMEEVKLDIQRSIQSLHHVQNPETEHEFNLLRANVVRLNHFAKLTMSDHDYESAIQLLINKADQFGLDLLWDLMNDRIQVLIKVRRLEEARSLRVEMLERWPDNLAVLHGVVEDLRSNRKHDEVRNLLESSVAADRRWTLVEWNAAFRYYLNWLRQRGEFESALALCERWIAQCPMSEPAYEHKLRSLIELDRANDVKTLLAEWFESSRLAPPRRALHGASGNPNAGTTNVASLHSDLEEVDAQSLNQANTLKAHLAERDGYGSRLAPPRRALQGAPREGNSGDAIPAVQQSADETSNANPLNQADTLEAHLAERDGYIDPVVLAQLNAAMEFGFGRVAGLELDGPQLEFEPRMLTLAEFFAASDRRLDIADKVLGHSAIVKTASGKAMMTACLRRLMADSIEKVSSARLEAIFRWIQNSGIHGDVREAWLQALRTHLDQSLPGMDLKRVRILLMTYGQAFDEKTPIEQRQKWLDVLISRWRSTDNSDQRGELALLIEEFEDQAFDIAHQINWQRTRLKEAREFETSAAANGLFQKLLATSWSPDVENETWSLLELMPASLTPHTRRNDWLPLLQQWVTSMLSMRVVHHQTVYPGFNDLPQKQQQHAARECRVRAMREMIDVLTEKSNAKQTDQLDAADQVNEDTEGSRPAARRERDADILLHRLMLRAELAEADTIVGVTDEERTLLLDGIIRETKDLLGSEPETTPDPNFAPIEVEKQIEQRLALRQRHFAFALWLHAALKRDELQRDSQTQAEQTDEDQTKQKSNSHTSEVLNYVRKGIEKDTVAPDAWRAAEYGILIALDRSDELVSRLQEWTTARTSSAPWTIYLAQLLVELDRLEEAIDLYQVRGDKDLLTVHEWYQLSLWQHALDHRAASERSKRMAWARTPSNELQKQLTNELEQWNSGSVEKTPSAPESVKERFAILLPKTEHPDHAIRLLANWYKATHDSQLLISMAPFVTGQSRGKMRDALEYTQSAINDVDQEAGIDAIEESIRQTEIRVKSAADRPQSEIDLLALNILSLQTASAGARITNQPRAHVDRATSILGQLLKHNWQPDERQWFALRLHNLPINIASLKQTRLEGMKTLLQAVPEGSTERRQIANLTAQVMINEKHDHDALRLLEAEINGALGLLSKPDAGISADPELVANLVRTLVRLLHEARQYQASERWLTETTLSVVIPDRDELLFDTHVSALLHGGRTSLGEKSSLYESLQNQTLTRVLEAEGSDEFQRAWRQLFQVLRSGQHQRIKAVAVDTLAIAKTHANALVRQHSDRDDEIIDALFKMLNETNQRQAAIEFLLERLESQPLALQWTAPRQRWNNFADDLYATAVQTNDTKNGGKHYELYPEAIPLRDRFENVLFLGLEKTFAVLGDQHSELFSAERDELWKNGNKRFLEIIDRVAAANPDSQPHLMHLANRLISHHHGQRENAIRILRSANDRKVLDVNGQNQLVSYLFDAEQFQDAVRVLEDIIRVYPSDTTPRISLMTALYKLGQRERLLAELNSILNELLDPETADLQKVWSLADSCRECELWQEASDLYNRGITRHGWPRSPSLPLSDAWRNLAECQARLNQTADALNSVSAAWVVCGQDASRRNYAQATLESVMSQTQDLTAVTELLDQKASKDGDDSSFLRRALGKAMLDKSSFESAEAQLRIALSLQPQDNEAWSSLIAALDAQDRSADAVNAVHDQSDTNIRDISLYRDLHQRLTTLKLPDEAERAATSLIEVAMSEADHHMSLAQIRDSQDLHSGAVNHWQIASDLRKEDPTPLAGLAKAQIRMGDPAAARRTLNRLVITAWDERFEDLPNELRSIRRQLRKQERAEP